MADVLLVLAASGVAIATGLWLAIIARVVQRVGRHRSEVRMWRQTARAAGIDRDRWMGACIDAWRQLDQIRQRQCGRRP